MDVCCFCCLLEINLFHPILKYVFHETTLKLLLHGVVPERQ